MTVSGTLLNIFYMLLPNQTWVLLPSGSKGNLLTSGCDEGKNSAYGRAPSKEKRQLRLERPELPDGLPGRGFKGSAREGAAGHDQLVHNSQIGWHQV